MMILLNGVQGTFPTVLCTVDAEPGQEEQIRRNSPYAVRFIR